MRKLYDGTTACIAGTKTRFDILCGCRQGGWESPSLFNYYFDFVLKVCAEELERKYPDGWGISFDYRIPGECTDRKQRGEGRMSGVQLIRWLLYADDLVLFCPTLQQAEGILNVMNNVCKRFGLTISFKKTKIMQFQTNTTTECFTIDGHNIDNVDEFCYLGHTIYKNNGDFCRCSRCTCNSKISRDG